MLRIQSFASASPCPSCCMQPKPVLCCSTPAVWPLPPRYSAAVALPADACNSAFAADSSAMRALSALSLAVLCVDVAAAADAADCAAATASLSCELSRCTEAVSSAFSARSVAAAASDAAAAASAAAALAAASSAAGADLETAAGASCCSTCCCCIAATLVSSAALSDLRQAHQDTVEPYLSGGDCRYDITLALRVHA